MAYYVLVTLSWPGLTPPNSNSFTFYNYGRWTNLNMVEQGFARALNSLRSSSQNGRSGGVVIVKSLFARTMASNF